MKETVITLIIRRFTFMLLLNALMITVVAASGHAKDITLAWDPSPDETIDHYVVYWGTASGSYTHNSPPVTGATSYTITGLDEGKVYYFAAKAVGANGLESEYSNEAAIPRIESPTDDCLVNSDNADGYTLKGTAAASSVVEILIDANPLATTTATETGTWSLDVDFTTVPECRFELNVVSTGATSTPVAGQFDQTSPISTITDLPRYASDNITVPWTANDDVSGIATTELWYKKGSGGSWTKTELSSDGVEGSFLFSPPLGGGIYYLATCAVDNLGNAEGPPAETGKGEVVCDQQPPTSNSVMQFDPKSATVTVDWTALDDLSGVASTKLYYRGGTDGKWIDSGLDPQTGTSGVFTYSAQLADASYSFQTRSVDRAGNVETIDTSPTDDDRIIVDKTPPASSITEAPDFVEGLLSAHFTIHWSASDDTSNVTSTTLWVKKGADGTWVDTGLAPQSGGSGLFTYRPPMGEGTYYFATRSSDDAGNTEIKPSGAGSASTHLQASLSDAITAMQAVSGIDVGELNKSADINGDQRIGIQEAIFFLRLIMASVPAV